MGGQRVTTLLQGKMEAGVHDVRWDGTNTTGKNVPSGIYFLKTVADEIRDTKRVVRMR